MELVDNYKKHRSEPEKTIEAYIKEVRLKLGSEIYDQKKIYLDTKYWLLLRDIILGTNKDEHLRNLLLKLRENASEKRLICPISEDILIEILRQSDPLTLNASVALIDELSSGVSIISSEERIKFEILHFIHKKTNGEDSVYTPNEFVWTKIPYTLGYTMPTALPVTSEEELVIQKAFMDYMWTASLSDMVGKIGMESISNMPRVYDISYKLNEDKLRYAHENKSFKQIFLSEISGVIDLFKNEFENALVYLYEFVNGTKPTESELNATDSGQLFANLIYNAFKRNKLSTDFATLVIGAGLHASVRLDLGRKYEENDMPDFRHAQTALPYYDCFLTEHSLRDLVTRKNIKFNEKYNCEVVSHPIDAVELIEKISS